MYAVETSVKGLKLMKASSFPIDGTGFYSDAKGKWLAINPNENKKATTTAAQKAPAKKATTTKAAAPKASSDTSDSETN